MSRLFLGRPLHTAERCYSWLLLLSANMWERISDRIPRKPPTAKTMHNTLLNHYKLGLAIALLLFVWIIPHEPITTAVRNEFSQRIGQIPSVKVDWSPSETFRNRFSTTKTVLYFETDDNIKHVTPLLMHMTQIVPPEWRFVFIGSDNQVNRVARTGQAQHLIEIGKLRVERINQYFDNHDDVGHGEIRNRLLTNLTFYDTALPGVENLMTFQSNTIMCANAKKTVNDYLDYDWVGAPWHPNDKFGGNGGLSVRRVSKIREVLDFQNRYPNSGSEDGWLASRIGLLPDSSRASAKIESTFSVESIYKPESLGFVVPADANFRAHPDVWDDHDQRLEIMRYCPELKIIMPMRLEREKCL